MESKIKWLVVDYKTQLRKLREKEKLATELSEYTSALTCLGKILQLEIVISNLENILENI